MPVYRWESKELKVGPYSDRFSHANAVQEMAERHCFDDPAAKRPTLASEGYDWTRFDLKDYYKFGFNSIEQMNEWFTFEDQIVMLANGFKLTTYKDSEVHIYLVTPRQVVFALKADIAASMISKERVSDA